MSLTLTMCFTGDGAVVVGDGYQSDHGDWPVSLIATPSSFFIAGNTWTHNKAMDIGGFSVKGSLTGAYVAPMSGWLAKYNNPSDSGGALTPQWVNVWPGDSELFKKFEAMGTLGTKVFAAVKWVTSVSRRRGSWNNGQIEAFDEDKTALWTKGPFAGSTYSEGYTTARVSFATVALARHCTRCLTRAVLQRMVGEGTKLFVPLHFEGTLSLDSVSITAQADQDAALLAMNSGNTHFAGGAALM